MSKLDSTSAPLLYPVAGFLDHERPRYLLVLIPANVDYMAAIRRIWELAIITSLHVQLLSLCKDPVQELSIRRQLITMAALMTNGNVSVDVRVEIGTRWIDVVKKNYKTGDMIVCFAKQRVGLLQTPLNQILQAKLGVSVYILTGRFTEEYPGSKRLSKIVTWVGALGIIGGFFLLQFRLTLMPDDWIQLTLLILTVLFEFWLIFVWNSLYD